MVMKYKFFVIFIPASYQAGGQNHEDLGENEYPGKIATTIKAMAKDGIKPDICLYESPFHLFPAY